MRSRFIIVFFAFSSLSLLVTLSACQPSDADPAPYYHRVTAVSVDNQPGYTAERQFVGRVEASQRVSVGFELPGTIVELTVDDGDRIVAGQILARLDTRLLEAELNELQASQEELRARGQLVKLDIKRQKQLRTQGFAAEQRMDELQAESKVLAAQLKRQQALAGAVQTRMEKSTLVAPYNGSIALRHVERGAVVAAGQQVLDLLEAGAAQAKVGLPLAMARELTLGEMLQVQVNNQWLPARLEAVGNAIDPVTRTVSMRLSLPAELGGADGELMIVQLPEYRQQTGFWVPVTALADGVRGTWNVLTLLPTDQEGLYQLESRSVQLVYLQGERAYLSGAISDGEQLVAAGTHKLAAGQQVRTGPALAGGN
ncbi:MAG: efflux RND transporter periplasmic adaptor subunit [Halieaceae bacterium]|nr:efflux RND transporter periplasmic adaptor subunit [Halieaceae bacterium]